MPCPSALGATWDHELVGRLAAALGVEARSKGVDILLAPTVNLMRTPLGGRGFEFFAEDPVLAARLAVDYVRGLQAAGVAATVKHYVGNDSETGRWSYDARIGRDRTARAVPRAVRGVRPRGRRLAGHGLLQQGQRRPDGREPAPAARRAEKRVGLRRRRHLRLGRGPQHARDGRRDARPVHAGSGRAVGRPAHPGRARRRGQRGTAQRQGHPAAAARPAGRRVRRARFRSTCWRRTRA